MKKLRCYYKKVSYKGKKGHLPDNVSIRSFKEIINLCGGYTDLIQPIIDLLSRKQN